MGLPALFQQSFFLDYSALPIPGIADSHLRSQGILFIEIGVGLGVYGILVTIFDTLLGPERPPHA